MRKPASLFVVLSLALSSIPPAAVAQLAARPAAAASAAGTSAAVVVSAALATGLPGNLMLAPAAALSAAPAAANAAPEAGSAGWIPVAVRINADGAELEKTIRALTAHGFHANPTPARAIAPGVYAVFGVALPGALPKIAAENIAGVSGILDLLQIEKAQRVAARARTAVFDVTAGADSASVEPDAVPWNALLQKSGDIAAEREKLLARRQTVQIRHYAHMVHALQGEKSYDAESGEWVHPNVLAVKTKAQLEDIDARLAKLADAQGVQQDAILSRRVQLEDAGMAHIALLAEPATASLAPLGWAPPTGVGDVASKGALTPAVAGPAQVQGVPTAQWGWFYSHGFDLNQEPNKPLRVTGRWTGREIDYAGIGISVSGKDDVLGFAKGAGALAREDALRWLQIAEMSSAGAPAAPALSDDQKKAADAGRKLLSWGVPPHILNNSQDVVAAVSPSGDKTQVSLSPDAKFYTFYQGVPLATQTGSLLVEFLEKLEAERPGQAKRLTRLELQSLAYLIDRQVKPWWQFDPQGAEKLMDQLYTMLRDGKIIKPLLEEPIGIDVSAPAFDLAGYLASRHAALSAQLAAAARGEAPLSDIHSLAMAARFAWTQLTVPGKTATDFRTVVHDDGLAFLKQTGWERAESVWRLLPLGETVLQLGLSPILQYAIENNVQGDPLAIADAGWVDVFHPDVAKARLIFRDGTEVTSDRFFIPDAPLAAVPAAPAAAPSPIPAPTPAPTPAPAPALRVGVPTAKKGPLQQGAEVSRIDSHSTAIAGLLGLAATALHTQLVSIDLPGFKGAQDIVPPGVNMDDFFTSELSRSMLSAIEKWGVKFFNFSWGGGLGGKNLHAFLDEVSAKYGVKIFVAEGNSGPGFSQATAPSFASSVYDIGALDGLGSRSGFTSGGGFLLAEDGKIVFTPTIATLGGAVLPNSRLMRIPENPDASILYLFEPNGDYIHIRGTSFASPLAMMVLSLLTGIARHQAGAALRAQGLSADETAQRLKELSPKIDAAVRSAATETAQMPPGVPAVYTGQGALQPAAALARLRATIPGLVGGEPRDVLIGGTSSAGGH